MTRRASLLVVHDDEWNRDTLSRRLTQDGYDVSVATDGLEALARADTAVFDLVLLAVAMPGLSGLDVLTRLRSTRSQTELPVIMVTARADGADIVEAFRLGANDYITTPIDFSVVLARVGTHLSHKWAIERLRESEERYALAVQGANDGLWDWNLATSDVYWSPRWKAMLGYGEHEVGPDPDEWFTRVHLDDIGRVQKELADHLANGIGQYESEHRMLHRDGTFRWVLCRGAAVRNKAGAATRLAGSLTDITGTRVADGLTGLPNRVLFVDLLERAIKRCARRKDYQFALLVLGLNRFKAVNHTFGLLSADGLLVDVAARLQSCLRSTDCLTGPTHGFTLARLGGDEFTVLVDDIADASDAVRVAERLRSALEQPFVVAGQQVFTSATVGIAVSTTGYDRPDDILRDAAIALHRAKAGGTAAYELFDAAMRHRAVARLQMETDLRRGVENAAFEVHYQPIITLDTRTIAGFEALVRWRHPTRGLVGPAEFIPVAEDTGMILQIGRLVLTEACRQMADWQRRFGPAAPEVICVNVSNRQFADPGLSDHIEAILQQTGLDPSSLELEITESAFLGDLAAAQLTLNRGRALGIAWSLDDFGTGYSSLSHLHRLKVGTVKVDRAFVSRLGLEEGGTEMVRAIIALAHSLSMDVVAEGVETIEQVERLHDLGCEYAQGYYFAEPLTGAAATEWLASRATPSGNPSSLITDRESLIAVTDR